MCYSYGGLPSNRRAAVPSRRESTGVGLPWWGETRAESTGADRNRQEASCAPSHPRVDSVPPLSRCPRAPRSAWANSTPVDSCRLLSIRLGVGLARNSTPVDSRRLLPIRPLARPTLVSIVRLSSKRLLRSGDDHRARDAFVLPCLPRFQERSQGASVRSDKVMPDITGPSKNEWYIKKLMGSLVPEVGRCVQNAFPQCCYRRISCFQKHWHGLC